MKLHWNGVSDHLIHCSHIVGRQRFDLTYPSDQNFRSDTWTVLEEYACVFQELLVCVEMMMSIQVFRIDGKRKRTTYPKD